MSFLSKLLGKKSPASPDNAAPPPPQDDDDGFVDLDLPIAEVAALDNGVIRVVARGIVDAQEMGFAVELGGEWDARLLNEGSQAYLYWGHCTYLSIGEASDRFVQWLAERYGISAAMPLRMLPEIKAQLVGLNSDPAQVRSSPVHAKAFFHTDTDTDDTPEEECRYAEVFTNIDLLAGQLEFHEKDPGYRLALLRALTE